jgi:putative chitobiose transport system substrate-binding protein
MPARPHHRRRLLRGLSLAPLATLAALGPGGAALVPATAAEPAPRRLTLWTMQLAPFHNAYVQGLIRSFERAHPGVRVHWVDVPWAEMERKTLTAIAAGAPPDVVNLNPQFSAKLAELGALAEPEAYLSPQQVAAYLPAAWAANRLGTAPGARSFALPWYVTTNLTLAHRGLLARAGVDVPRTLPELLQAARRIRETTGAYAYFPALDGSAPLEAMVAAQGRFLTADGCGPGFADDAGAQVIDSYRQLYQQGLVPRNVLTEGHRTAVTAFLSGQVAMISTGMQFLQQVKTASPEVYAQVEVAPPVASARANLSVMNLAVPATAADKALAFALALHVTSSENQLELARRVPVLPSTAASYSDALFTTPGTDPLLARARALSVRQVFSGAVLVPPVPRYGKLQSSFVRNLQATMLGHQTADEAVARIDREWRAVIGCARKAAV